MLSNFKLVNDGKCDVIEVSANVAVKPQMYVMICNAHPPIFSFHTISKPNLLMICMQILQQSDI